MDADLSAARFPGIGRAGGHYESFYLKVADPSSPRGAWLRHTVFKRPGEEPVGSLWVTVWDGEGEPEAFKATLPPDALGVAAAGGEYLHVGDSVIAPGRAEGAAGDGAAAWDLSWTAGEGEDAAAFPYLPRPWMYRAPLPRTKAVSVAPRAVFSGEVVCGGRRVVVDGWPGMLGHNWGSEHAERWIWLHGTGFGEREDAWLDGTIGRLKVGPLIVPWVANACLSLDGERHRLGGPERMRATRVEETATGCAFVLPGDDVVVHGEVRAPAADRCVGWVYSDPGGGEHRTANCSVAAMSLTVERRRGTEPPVQLSAPAGAAYELGAREAPAGVAIQPFADP